MMLGILALWSACGAAAFVTTFRANRNCPPGPVGQMLLVLMGGPVVWLIGIMLGLGCIAAWVWKKVEGESKINEQEQDQED